MKRLPSLIIEGGIGGAVIGVFVSFITENLLVTVAVSAFVGILVRLLSDYIWKKYNQFTGKGLD